MILVSVRKHKASYLVTVFHEIRYVGYNEVDTEHILIGKTKAAINYHDIIRIFNGGNVFTDLIKSAKRNDTQFTFLFFWHIISFSISVMYKRRKNNSLPSSAQHRSLRRRIRPKNKP